MRKICETLLLRARYGLASRFRIGLHRWLGMKIGVKCRLEAIRIRRPSQIVLGNYNAITEGGWLWPIDGEHDGIRIRIGDYNYFNRDLMIDACGYVQIGDHNMFGPRVYITDSNHTLTADRWVHDAPMSVGKVIIGNGCWIGANATILKDVLLGDRCVVAAGAVVTRDVPAGAVVAGVPARVIRPAANPPTRPAANAEMV